MCGVSDNTEKTDAAITDTDAHCILIGSVSLITEILKTLTLVINSPFIFDFELSTDKIE
jgi:hypothetical protein